MYSPFANHGSEDDVVNLPAIPEGPVPFLILLQQIACYRFILDTRAEESQEPCGNGRFAFQACSPFSSGSPFQSFTSDCWVSRTIRSPRAVVRKCFLARPPRAAVASPKYEETSPFSSSLVSAS